MPINTIKAVYGRKVTLAVAIERTKLEKDEKKMLALGVFWGQEGAEKAIEIRLSVLSRWPFLCLSIKVGPVPPSPTSPPSSPLPIWEPLPRDDIKEVERMEKEKEREEHWVAPGESRKSFDAVVGHDQPYF